MQKIFIIFVIALLSVTAMAQDRKVAIFDPAGNVDNSIKEIIREEISSIIVNAGGYTVLERQLINKVLEENRFQTGGLVDDSQISEMGNRMGANLVFVTNITVLGNANYYISCKIIDVQTARIEKQRTAQSSHNLSDLITVVQKSVTEMLGVTTTNIGISQQTGRLFSDESKDRKVAIFDPAGTVDNSIREIVREEISSIIVNADGYTVLERQLINKVLEENRFQSGGLVDDSQMSEIGKRMGANLVFVTNMTAMSGDNHYVSCKLIDVETARIEKQRTAQTQRGANELIDVVQKIVREMFEYTEKPVPQPQQTSRPAVVEKPTTKPEITSDILVAKDRTVLKGGRELSKTEVRMLMAQTDALRMYNKGLSRNRNGSIFLVTGIGLFAGGAYVHVTDPFEERYSYYGSDGNLYYGYDEKIQKIGGIMMAAGAVIAITGATLKMTSKIPVQKSVNMYNSSKSVSNLELKFDVTGNGVRLALRF